MFKTILVLLFLISNAYAESANNWTLSGPPKDPDKSSQYLFDNSLYTHFNQLQTVTVDPNGNRKGNIGDLVLYKNGVTYTTMIETATPNGTTWQSVGSGSGAGTVTSVATSAPITGGTITTTGTIGITQSGVATNGYLSSTDWNTFNNKGSGTVTSVTLATPSATLSLGGTNPVTTSGTINADIDLTHANTWTGLQTFSASGKSLISSNNTGIGTITPGQLLDVAGNERITGTNSLFFGNDNKASISGSSATNPDIKFSTNSLERMVVNKVGNVGIGTNSPHEQFAVVENVLDTVESTVINTQNTTGANARFTGCSGDECGYIYKTGSNYSNVAGWASRMILQASGITLTTGAGTGDMRFETAGTGTGNIQMTLTNAGNLTMTSGKNVGIGTATPGTALDISGTASKVRMRSADGTVWNCQPANGTGIFTCV